MARPKTNKSAAVRELLNQKPDMPAKDIQKTLAARGMKVQGSLIYFVKGQLRSSDGTSGLTINAITKLKQLAEEVGGYEKLRELLDVLAG